MPVIGRDEKNANRSPFGDQTGYALFPGANVVRVVLDRSRLITQMSATDAVKVPRPPPGGRDTATRRSSGASAMCEYGAGSATVPSTRPDRSFQVSCVRLSFD